MLVYTHIFLFHVAFNISLHPKMSPQNKGTITHTHTRAHTHTHTHTLSLSLSNLRTDRGVSVFELKGHVRLERTLPSHTALWRKKCTTHVAKVYTYIYIYIYINI